MFPLPSPTKAGQKEKITNAAHNGLNFMFTEIQDTDPSDRRLPFQYRELSKVSAYVLKSNTKNNQCLELINFLSSISSSQTLEECNLPSIDAEKEETFIRCFLVPDLDPERLSYPPHVNPHSDMRTKNGQNTFHRTSTQTYSTRFR